VQSEAPRHHPAGGMVLLRLADPGKFACYDLHRHLSPQTEPLYSSPVFLTVSEIHNDLSFAYVPVEYRQTAGFWE